MPPETANVSVVIPVYRATATIDRALASVAAQTLKPREVIVVDDGSDDGTFEKTQAWSHRLGDTALVVIKENHRGAGSARNRGLIESSGEYIAFLDADDEWLPGKIEKCLAAIRQNNCDFLSHNYFLVEEDTVSPIDCAKNYRNSKNPFVGYFLKGYVSTSTVIARRSILIKAGGFDPGLPSGQDYEFWLVVLDQPTTTFVVLSEPLMKYHITPNSISANIDMRRRQALIIARRHAYRLSRHCPAPLWILTLRTMIIHAQAALSFRAQRQFGNVLRICLMMPFSLVANIGTISRTSGTRPNFLNTTHD